MPTNIAKYNFSLKIFTDYTTTISEENLSCGCNVFLQKFIERCQDIQSINNKYAVHNPKWAIRIVILKKIYATCIAIVTAIFTLFTLQYLHNYISFFHHIFSKYLYFVILKHKLLWKAI